MKERNLVHLLEDMANLSVEYTYLGEGIERVAFLMESGEFEGKVVKMGRDTAEEFGINNIIRDGYDTQTESEIQFYKELLEKYDGRELTALKNTFILPEFYDLEHGVQILEQAQTICELFVMEQSDEENCTYGGLSGAYENFNIERVIEHYGEESVCDFLIADEALASNGYFLDDLHDENIGIIDDRLVVIDAGL